MINRICDGVSLPEESFEQLAKTLSKLNGMKFHTLTASKQEADEIASELKNQKKIVKVNKYNNIYNIYYCDEKLKLASNQNYFTPIGNNFFKANEKIAGVYDYDFDDGAIWEVKHFDDGDYLVKTIQSDDENDVVRLKTANLNNDIISILKKNKLIVSEQLLTEIKNIVASKNISTKYDLEEEVKKYCSKVV
jgi:hypothetical protein